MEEAVSWIEIWGELLEKDIFDLATADQCVEKIAIPSPDHTIWLHHLKMMMSNGTFALHC